MASSVTMILLSLFYALAFETVRAQPGSLSLGSSLDPSIKPTAWFSPSKRFAFGFFPEGNGFRIGIWIVGAGNNISVVWTANRDQPVVPVTAKLNFVEGKIQLTTEQGQHQPIAVPNPTESATSASMLDSGNFVLYNDNQYGKIVWQSFESPTDTILGGQTLGSGKELVSSVSPVDHSPGRLRLKMQYDGNLVAYPVDTDDSLDAYWATNTWRTGKTLQSYLFLSITGDLYVNDTIYGEIIPIASPPSNSSTIASLYRATIGSDGNIRLFSHSFDAKNTPMVFTVWEAIPDICDVKGYCGFNSYCTRIDSEPQCICIPGFDFVQVNQTTGGCERNFTSGRCIQGKEDIYLSNMTSLNLDSKDRPYFYTLMPDREECTMSCLQDCYCDAAFYSDSYCSKYKLPVKYLKNTTAGSSKSSIAFFKHTSDITTNPTVDPAKQPWATILSLSLSFVAYSFIVLAFFSVFIFKFHVMKYRKLLLETRTASLIKEFTLRTYTYRELKKATKDFKQELGKGAFGAVHKGTFDKGKSYVAVKRLEKVVEEGEREFRAEMRVIGRTRHKNLVRLFGYCIEGSKRLLVYEYMSNGSLADLLFKKEWRPDWNERVRIALDVAIGILYLHEECEAPIIHCDIKPQNILLDEAWNAKISDFGLAKLLMPDQTRTNTGARGTRGYMAPEWNKNIPISVKVDVYSFGIVLLEIVCCRRNLQVNLSKPEETLLSAWAYRCFEAKEMNKLVRDYEEVDKRSFERMVMVAFWCIQDEPALRFPMKTVMLMLEGFLEVPIPPCPSDYYCSQS